MTKGLLFWVIMLLLLIFGLWANYPLTNYPTAGFSLVTWVLLALLGWHCFGAAVK